MFAALPHPVRPRGQAARIARAFTTLLRTVAPALRRHRRVCAPLSMHISTTDLFASILFSLIFDKETFKTCFATKIFQKALEIVPSVIFLKGFSLSA